MEAHLVVLNVISLIGHGLSAEGGVGWVVAFLDLDC